MQPYRLLIMLGTAPETRGSIAAVVDAYRMHGLFKRWPIEYVATHSAGPLARRGTLAIGAFGRLAALLAEHRRAVLHVHTAPHFSFWRDAAYMSMAVTVRCPVILQLHGSGFEAFYDACSTVARALIRELLERAAWIAAPSQQLVSWVRSVSTSANAGFLPNPVALPDGGYDGARPNMILFLGKLAPQKGIFDLIDALASVRREVPDVRLVCAGEGSRIAVARYAERLGVADAVKFTGWVGPSGKRALLESASVFALPSYSEGMPMSLLEAMAAGVPAIATPVGGIPEVLADGASGFLAAPGDVATLARLLRRLLLDRGLAAKVGAAGRETVRLRFAPERAIARLEQIYAELGMNLQLAPWPASRAG
jgi:glycosyltransferase involved in cell wall biosynthesis